MNRRRVKAKSWGLGMAGLCSFGLACALLGMTWFHSEFPTVARGPRPPDGRPTSGSSLAESRFQEWLPPAPGDALPYEIREPLFNGLDVTLKRRWLWVPPGRAIQETRRPGGPIVVLVPPGTKFWKEFYLDTPQGPRLVERRLSVKAADRDGFLGWRFYTAHHLRSRFSRQERSDMEPSSPYFLEADSWLPTQPRPRPLRVEFQGPEANRRPYIYPGTSQCASCHGGATGWYSSGSNSLALGLTDLLADHHLRAELKDRGWLRTDRREDRPLPSPAPSSEDLDLRQKETDAFIALLRHNCLTCHNAGARAVARRTGFVLDPQKHYSTRDLIDALARPGVMRGAQTPPLVVPGSPESSELLLRLEGSATHRRMPPEEGGVPAPHLRLIERARAWISHSGKTDESRR